MVQAIFDDTGFKVKEEVIKVVPKKVKSIKDISVDELKVLCFHNHCNVCHWLASDLQPCIGICYGWISFNIEIIEKIKKKTNKHMVHILDIIDKIECLKGFRAIDEKIDGRMILQTRVGV